MNISFAGIAKYHNEERQKRLARLHQLEKVGNARVIASNRLALCTTLLAVTFLAAWALTVPFANLDWASLTTHLDVEGPWFVVPTVVLVSSGFGTAFGEGGGAVLFPVMLLGLNAPLDVIRDHALLIQCVGAGLVALSNFLAAGGRATLRHATLFGIFGGLGGLMTGFAFADMKLGTGSVAMLFVVVWLVVGTAFCISSQSQLAPAQRARQGDCGRGATSAWVLQGCGVLLAAFLGGLVASICGFGIDGFMYLAMVLVVRARPQAASSGAAIVATVTMVSGLGMRCLVGKAVAESAVNLFLVSAPTAVIGSSIGLVIRDRIGNGFALGGLTILVLSITNLAFTLATVRPWSKDRPFVQCLIPVGVLVIGISVFVGLDLLGRRLLEGQKEGVAGKRHIVAADVESCLDDPNTHQSEVDEDYDDDRDNISLDGVVESVKSEREVPEVSIPEPQARSYVSFMTWLEMHGTEAEKSMIMK